MFGEGARDNHTIPSALAAGLAKRTPYDVEVDNLGQDAYVSSQEVLLLIEQLRNGNIPDLVVFYDGVNDTFAAFRNGVAGVAQSEIEMKDNYLISQWGVLKFWVVATVKLIQDSILGRIAKHALAMILPHKFEVVKNRLVRLESPMAASKVQGDSPQLETAVVNVYFNNVRIVESLARSYDFRCLFYWQPNLFSKQKLSPYELEQERSAYPGEARFFRAVYARMGPEAAAHEVRDLSAIFGSGEQPYYIDSEHINEEGNQIVAGRMLPEVAETLNRLERERG